MRRRRKKKFLLFFNSSEEDKRAILLVGASGMPCEFFATSNEDAPYLFDGLQKVTGFDEIEEFVEDWKEENQLPA